MNRVQQCDGVQHLECVVNLFRQCGDRYLRDLAEGTHPLNQILKEAQTSIEHLEPCEVAFDAPRFSVKHLGAQLERSGVLLLEDPSHAARYALNQLEGVVAEARADIIRLAATTDACSVDPALLAQARQLFIKSRIHRTTGLVDTLSGGGSASLYILAPEGEGFNEHGRGRHIAPDRPLEADMERDNAVLTQYYHRYEADVLRDQRGESTLLEKLEQQANKILALGYANLILIGLRGRGVV